ncbi:pectate lyase [Clostridium acetobutylicum]|nr:pectate lyase [Clostridium acetobutylicum]
MKYLTKKLFLISTFMGISLASVFSLATTAHASNFYISPNENDNNPGTISSPFLTISKAQEKANYGDTVYILGGTYTKFNITKSDANYNYVNNITKSGITYRAYSSKNIPIFDFSKVTPSKRIAAFLIEPGVSNVTFLSFQVTGVKVGTQKQSECFRVEGNATLNQIVCHDNEANGFYFVNHGTGSCIKCDSYNNIGPTKNSIGNTDGFGAHGDGVTFSYCRAWHNSDDGFDCLTSNGANTFDHCWAFNMNAGGDSNGFKIGGYGVGVPPNKVPVHTVKYCLSANNNAHGFYANHQPGQSATWTYNSAYNNKAGNFDMLERISRNNSTDIPGTREIVHYNIAYGGNAIKDSNLPSQNVSNNSWNKNGIVVSSSDFQNLDVNQLSSPRGTNGALPLITFMHLTSGSPLAGLGCF